MKEKGELIEDIIKGMHLGRKTRVTKKQKEAFLELRDDVGAVNNKLNKLHLRLWHAGYKGDYHSLAVGEVSRILEEARLDIDSILEKISSSEL